MAAMGSKTIFQAFLAVTAAFSAARAAASAGVLLRQSEFAARGLRLAPTALRGGGPAGNASVGRVGLLWNGCEVELAAAPPAFDAGGAGGSDGAVDYGREVAANGFFTTAAAAPELDPVAWVAKADAGGGTWVPVGASGTRLRFDGQLSLYPLLPSPTPEARGARVVVDLRPRWQWAVQYVASYAHGVVAFLVMLALVVRDRQEAIKWPLVAHYGAAAAAFASCAAAYAAAGDARAACELGLLVPEHALLAGGLALLERRAINILAAYGAAFFASGGDRFGGRRVAGALCSAHRFGTGGWAGSGGHSGGGGGGSWGGGGHGA